MSQHQETKSRSCAAFTLIELLIGAGLSGLILTGVLTAFLMIGRTSANIQNYTEIEADARKALEIIGRDIHAAYSIRSFSATSVELAIPDSTPNSPTTKAGAITATYPEGYIPSHYVAYAYDSAAQTITRTVRDSTHSNPVTTVLLTNVQKVPGLTSPYDNVFHYYSYIPSSAASLGVGYVNGPPIPIGSPGNNEITNYSSSAGVQQVEVKFYILRRSTTVTSATNKVLSARFILRNKSSST